ncbi:MAG TPA: type III glutamate--ammonia ligase [Rubrivivax sp.]|nr:type III glutamate--ammonia ligase [Rubrivivax sp.]
MKDLNERLRAAGVHTLLAQFTDLLGAAKGKLLPLTHLDELLADGISFSGPAIAGTGLPRIGPRAEYYARGNASTATVLPWMPGVARIVCDGFVNGQPFDACPRQILKRAVARLADRGWHLRTGIEPEFFLLRRDGGRLVPADPLDALDKPSYDLKSLSRQQGLLHELQVALAKCGLDVLQIDHGDAQGQYELNFGFDEAVTSADHLMLFKLGAHAMAEAQGMVFSMMPKPFRDQPGSGMHFHVSLWSDWNPKRPDNAHNVFVPHRSDGSADRERSLSPVGRQFIGGVLAHAAALTALVAPTVNSYKRLRVLPSRSGTSWAPAHVAQGPHNRTAALRTLYGRFEWRVPDAAANPYLATAALIAAGLDGIDRKLEPPDDCTDDLFELPAAQLRERGIALLPQSLGEALDALAADELICMMLGETAAQQFVQLKRGEIAEYRQHISDWEWRRYAEAF